MRFKSLKYVVWNLIVSSLLTLILLIYFQHEDNFSNVFVFWMFTLIIPLIVGLCGAFIFTGNHYLRLLFSATPIIIAPILYISKTSTYSPDAEASSLLIAYIIYWLIASAIFLFLTEYLRKRITKKNEREKRGR